MECRDFALEGTNLREICPYFQSPGLEAKNPRQTKHVSKQPLNALGKGESLRPFFACSEFGFHRETVVGKITEHSLRRVAVDRWH